MSKLDEIGLNADQKIAVMECIVARERLGARFSIVVVAEGAKPKGGEVAVVAKAHGGSIEVTDGDPGARFVVSLPTIE